MIIEMRHWKINQLNSSEYVGGSSFLFSSILRTTSEYSGRFSLGRFRVLLVPGVADDLKYERLIWTDRIKIRTSITATITNKIIRSSMEPSSSILFSRYPSSSHFHAVMLRLHTWLSWVFSILCREASPAVTESSRVSPDKISRCWYSTSNDRTNTLQTYAWGSSNSCLQFAELARDSWISMISNCFVLENW